MTQKIALPPSSLENDPSPRIRFCQNGTCSSQLWKMSILYQKKILDLVYFYKATHNMIHLDPSVVPLVRKCARRTRISVISSKSFVPKKCRTSTFQKSFFIRTTRIWNLLITRLDLHNVTFENFKSVLYGYYSRALAINYDPDTPRSFKSICLKCNTARFLDQEISCCM